MASRKNIAQEMVEIGPRKMAETMLEGAGLSLIMAFNMTDNPERPWRFSKETHAQVARLIQEMHALFASGGFSEQRAPAAQVDADFQRFIARAIESKP